jgi:hypothetical protein
MSLRRSYRDLLIFSGVVVLPGRIVSSVAIKLAMLDFVAVAATAAPALLWWFGRSFGNQTPPTRAKC